MCLCVYVFTLHPSYPYTYTPIYPYPLNILLLQLIHNIRRGAHGERQYRPRRVLVGLRYEGTSVHYEQVLALVRLVELVDDRLFRIVAHPRGADLVNDPSRRCQSELIFFGICMTPGDDATCVRNNFFESFGQVSRRLQLMLARFVTEAKRGYPVLVDRGCIDFAVVFFTRNRLSSS